MCWLIPLSGSYSYTACIGSQNIGRVLAIYRPYIGGVLDVYRPYIGGIPGVYRRYIGGILGVFNSPATQYSKY